MGGVSVGGGNGGKGGWEERGRGRVGRGEVEWRGEVLTEEGDEGNGGRHAGEKGRGVWVRRGRGK